MNLKQVFEQRLQQMAEAVRGFPVEDRACYADWMAQTYYYVSHSTRLLALGAARFGVDQDKLHQRFLQHAAEEKRHEFLAASDVKALGYALKDFAELPETKAFYQSQYYWIQNVDPKAFFGYIVALEGLAVVSGADVHKRVTASLGDKALAFIKLHASDDPEHLETAYTFVEDFPPETQKLILETFEQSCTLFEHILSSIVRRQIKAPKRRAA